MCYVKDLASEIYFLHTSQSKHIQELISHIHIYSLNNASCSYFIYSFCITAKSHPAHRHSCAIFCFQTLPFKSITYYCFMYILYMMPIAFFLSHHKIKFSTRKFSCIFSQKTLSYILFSRYCFMCILYMLSTTFFLSLSRIKFSTRTFLYDFSQNT